MKKLPLAKIVTATILFLSAVCALPALGQTPADVGVDISAGTLTLTYLPGSLTMDPINVESPLITYYSYYTNPETVDPDENPTTADGTAVVVQDGRFDGGFTLMVQPDSNFVSGGNSFSSALFGVRTENTVISETLKNPTTATTAPSESPTDYTAFPNAVILLNSPAPCGWGRVGIYTVFPSFRLQIPNTVAAGFYTTTITYSLIDDYRC
jgi:hypothetical protein